MTEDGGQHVHGYPDYQRFQLSREGRVLTVTMTGATAMNLIDRPYHHELARIFADIAADPETDVVVLTGSDRSFCAGADLNWFGRTSDDERDEVIRHARKIIIDLLEVPQPIVAAVAGPAAGLGATLALFSDIVIVADNAAIMDPHVRIGLVAGDGGAIIWPLLIGVNRAKELLFTGGKVAAEEAHRLGLVNHVVPAAELLTSAHEMARGIAAGRQQAIRGTKASVNKILRDQVNLVLDTSLALERQSMSSKDHQAAVATFLDPPPEQRAD